VLINIKTVISKNFANLLKLAGAEKTMRNKKMEKAMKEQVEGEDNVNKVLG